MATFQRKLVHKQFNSPIGLYSEQSVRETVDRELKALGTKGIEIDEQIAKPLNLANSAVLRAVEEEEQIQCDPVIKCARESRSKQRFQQRPHTPVHQQQLKQIKTQYLSHQHDIKIDRDTVLKINRLAIRRNLHKREHSWPPTAATNITNATATETVNKLFKVVDGNSNVVPHIHNASKFNNIVCERHGIDVIRQKFSSATKIIEPTAQEVRQKREQQRKHPRQQQWRSRSGGWGKEVESEVCHLMTMDAPKEMINLVKHEKLMRKNFDNKSTAITDVTNASKESDKGRLENLQTSAVNISVSQTKEYECEKNVTKNMEESKLYPPTTIPVEKGFSHPETKAADEDIGLVEPKRQFYEHLTTGKKWYSYENLLAAVNTYPTLEPMIPQNQRRQACSLERGRDKLQCKRLPPQKPRDSSKLQKRSMKLATEIGILYDADAQQHNTYVRSLNQSNKLTIDDLEHMPLPNLPDKAPTVPNTVEQQNDDTKIKSLKDQQLCDDSCIYLRSIDLQDNTIAYIPAAITIVPSPTEEIMQRWMEANNLRANIKDIIKADDCCQLKNKNFILTPQSQQQQQQDDKQSPIETKTDTTATTCVTYLPSTSTDVQLAHQTNFNTKCNTHMNINTKTTTIPSMTTVLKPQGIAHSNNSPTAETAYMEGDKSKQPGVYYTDGEYLYGPYEPYINSPLHNNTTTSLKPEQQPNFQLHTQQPQIRKNTEAETESHHNNIANLTAKYEHIQKSINEHLRQIDTYIENAKTALKSTLATGNKPKSSSHIQLERQQYYDLHSLTQNDSIVQQQQQQQRQQIETPLKEILRKITNIMQEVETSSRNQNIQQDTCMTYQTLNKAYEETKGEENMPIVEKVLMDLNLLTTHLNNFDKTSNTAKLKPIIEQVQQTTPLNLQYETTTVSQPLNVLINEDMENKKIPLDKPNRAPIPPPPPPPPPTSSIMQQLGFKQEQRVKHIGDEQLLSTDKKLITAQKQSTPPHSAPPVSTLQMQYYDSEKMTMSAAIPQDGDVEKKKNCFSDFITTQYQQEHLVEQVIEKLGKLENMSKDNLVNIHVQPPAHANKIELNLNQQTSASTTATPNAAINEILPKDMVAMQKCNVTILLNASSKDDCNHENDPKSTKGNESQLKLHIKDFDDKIADKQFQKYDNPLTNNFNDVVSSNKNSGQKQLNKYVNTHQDATTNTDKNKIKDVKEKHNQQKEREKVYEAGEKECDSNHSSSSELSNTYKSCYELPSPYVTKRQISWEDVHPRETHITKQPSTNTSCNLSHIKNEGKEAILTTSVNIANLKHDVQIAQKSIKSPETYEIQPTSLAIAAQAMTAAFATTSGHVEMQFTATSKPRIQTMKQQPQQQLQQQWIEHRYHSHHYEQQPTSLIEPHTPTRSTSPFGLNNVDIPILKQRSTSSSPSRLRTECIIGDSKSMIKRHEELMQAIRKYPLPLVESHLPTRDTSPFSRNSVEMKNVIHSKSTSPKLFIDESSGRKYPAPLVEPHVPTRMFSPFTPNVVETNTNVYNMPRATTQLPVYSQVVDNQIEQDKEDQHQTASPICKYPSALIEPHVPTRSASPFGLNVVGKNQTASYPTPSPLRGQHNHHHYLPHHATVMKSGSTANDSSHKKTVVYAPQVEGHNIELLVHANTPMPYHQHADVSQIPATVFTEMMRAAKTSHDYTTTTSTPKDIIGNENCVANYIAGHEDEYNDVHINDSNDETTCDELQHINKINSTKQVKQRKSRNLNTTDIATTSTIAEMKRQQGQQREQQQKQKHVHKHELAHLLYEQCSGQHMPVDIITLPTSVINRSFDNVSPRPYITTEGYKRVAWPPTSEERIVREFTPQPQTQYQPAPAYNQQQYQPSAAPIQSPIYNKAPQNAYNIDRDTNLIYKQNPNETLFESFPPQTPETPIILKDKQFSRLSSQEPSQTAYQQQQQNQYHKPQNQPIQQHYHQEEPQYQKPLPNQQIYQQPNQATQQGRQPLHGSSGWKPICPPQSKSENFFTNRPIGSREITPVYQQQYQNYHQQPQRPPQQYQQQQYRTPSYDNYQQQRQQTPQQQYPPQAQYQAQGSLSPQQHQKQPPQQQYQQPAWAQQRPHQQQQQQYQQPPWAQQPQQYEQSQYQSPLNQYNQAPHYQQPQEQQQYNQFIPQKNQQQFNSYSQPQQQQHTVSHDQVDQQPQLAQDQRGISPGIITLRKETPITQKPAPVYTSQPAAVSFRASSTDTDTLGGSNMRGDLKWPPPEYKEAAAKENEERLKLAKGPVCRPRKVHRDYSSFFAKNALNHHYPSYKVPPGTQHISY